MPVEPESVLSFWFPPGLDADLKTHEACMQRWFQGGPALDREIAARFSDLHAEACRGELQSWENLPLGRLALIIVLDQFSRNLYRADARAYAQDPTALRLALGGVDAGMLEGLRVWERLFFSMPLSHCEHLGTQKRALELAPALSQRAPAHLKPVYDYCVQHIQRLHDEIARFGRHPQRNRILARESTPAELEYIG